MTPKSVQASPNTSIVPVTDSAAPTTSTHGLTPSPPSAPASGSSEPSVSVDQQQLQTLGAGIGNNGNSNTNSNGGEQLQPQAATANASNSDTLSFTAGDIGTDTSFLDGTGDFDFGLNGLVDGNFDFGMYLAELEENGDGGEVGVV